MARGEGDRLSDLPDGILIHILSMLPESESDNKLIVRSSVLSKRWRFLWKSVPISLDFSEFLSYIKGINLRDFVSSVNRELRYWRSSEKIRTFRGSLLMYDKSYVKDVDLWVYFAIKVAHVEDFTLEFELDSELYEFPQFAYKSTSLRNLDLSCCNLNPFGSVNWTSLLSLHITEIELTDGVMGKVLSGCPNLECLKLEQVWGIHLLEISSVKLRKLIIEYYSYGKLEILAPYIHHLQISGSCKGIRLQQINVASLITADLYYSNFYENLEEELSYLKEFVHGVAHVENLESSPWCIELLSILELKGWKFPPSSKKFLKLNAALEQLNFPGVCSFLQSSSDLETLVIDCDYHDSRELLSKYTNEDEQRRRFETYNFNSSLLHLKTIKIINFDGPLSGNKSILPYIKYFLKNATALEKFVIAAKFKGSDVPQDYVKMAQEFQSFPRSSAQALVVFSY